MVKVAIAGGTGDVGRHIVDSIVAAKKHDLIILARSPNSDLEKLGVNVATVSYDDPSSLTSALQGVHTLICTIAASQGDEQVNTQLALIKAAQEAGVSRFMPSEFGVAGYIDDPVEYFRYKAQVVEAVKKSGLEYTLFENGFFMNYLAAGTAGMGYFPVNLFIVDVERCTALIPGDGSSIFSITRVEDVALSVNALLDLPTWPEYSRVAGSRLDWNELITLAERIRGT